METKSKSCYREDGFTVDLDQKKPNQDSSLYKDCSLMPENSPNTSTPAKLYPSSLKLAPKASPNQTLISQFIQHSIPPLAPETSELDEQNVILQKITLCNAVFDFTDMTYLEEKDLKTSYLRDISSYLDTECTAFSEEFLVSLFKMISLNIFRELNTSSLKKQSEDEEEEFFLDPNWPHLHPIYTIFLKTLESSLVSTNILRDLVCQVFILRLLYLFNSEDIRERDFLKTILHRIYGNFVHLRQYIKKCMNFVFLDVIYDNYPHRGVAELLEILGSVINGFCVPIKEEHKSFLKKILIPLHKSDLLPEFHQQLSYCVIQYTDKDSGLTRLIIEGLLKYWPKTNSIKEIMFIGELEDLMEVLPDADIDPIIISIFRQISLCIQSTHFQVVERILYFWNNERFINILKTRMEVVLPIIFLSLLNTSTTHWNSSLHGLVYNAIRQLLEVDPPLFEKTTLEFSQVMADKKSQAKSRHSSWKKLEEFVYTKTEPPNRTEIEDGLSGSHLLANDERILQFLTNFNSHDFLKKIDMESKNHNLF